MVELRVGGVRKMHPVKTGLEILWVIIREFLCGKKFANVMPMDKAPNATK